MAHVERLEVMNLLDAPTDTGRRAVDSDEFLEVVPQAHEGCGFAGAKDFLGSFVASFTKASLLAKW